METPEPKTFNNSNLRQLSHSGTSAINTKACPVTSNSRSSRNRCTCNAKKESRIIFSTPFPALVVDLCQLRTGGCFPSGWCLAGLRSSIVQHTWREKRRQKMKKASPASLSSTLNNHLRKSLPSQSLTTNELLALQTGKSVKETGYQENNSGGDQT